MQDPAWYCFPGPVFTCSLAECSRLVVRFGAHVKRFAGCVQPGSRLVSRDGGSLVFTRSKVFSGGCELILALVRAPGVAQIPFAGEKNLEIRRLLSGSYPKV
ncbi:MAG: hypothetical protein BWY80_01206 [Firmicutes bacterium ADurb.Bin456]|nr:MAG: hypothetical protein BWY80_01206 [Firmicutes bacterium ADurb.Bin456]